MTKKTSQTVFFLAIFIALFYFKLGRQYPSGTAGLYSEFTQQICNQPLGSPIYVDHYSSHKIPFAYQPLSFYLFAFSISTLHMDQWQYLIFFPSITLFLSSIIIFSISKSISKNTITPYVATILFTFSHEIIAYHYGADGICRGLALTLSLLLIHIVLSIKKYSNINAIKTGLLLTLIVLTHGSYTLFSCLFLSISIILSKQFHFKNKIRFAAKIIIVVLVFSSPWWLTVISYYGFSVFINAINTHGNFYGLSYFLSIDTIKRLFDYTLYNQFESQLLLILSISGLIYNFSKKYYFHPLVLVASLLILGNESLRFIVICQVLNAIIFIDLIFGEDKAPLIYKTTTIFILVVLFIPNIPDITKNLRYISNINFDQIKNIKEIIKIDSFILISPNNIEQEWMPYLLQSKSVISPYGTEWTGDYWYQIKLTEKLTECILQKDKYCLAGLLLSTGTLPQVIIFNNQYNFDSIKTTKINNNYSYIIYEDFQKDAKK